MAATRGLQAAATLATTTSPSPGASLKVLEDELVWELLLLLLLIGPQWRIGLSRLFSKTKAFLLFIQVKMRGGGWKGKNNGA